MCIAIFIPKGKTIGKKTLRRCHEANSDGFGYAYFNDDKRLIVKKFVGDKIKDEIRKFYELRQQNLDKQFMVHFRIATHGAVGTKCCHPFVVNRKTVFCHNGILGTKFTSGLSKASDMSDTMMFNKLCLQKLPKDFMSKPVYKFLLEEAIGYSKMIIMNSDDKVWILNEKQGEWDHGIWYSNTTYKKTKSYYYGGYGYDDDNSWVYDPKTGCYTKKKSKTKYLRTYDIDDWDDYPYGTGYGRSGWSNYGNGYSVVNNDGVVETPGDKKDSNDNK